jgi:hypothetical protein
MKIRKMIDTAVAVLLLPIVYALSIGPVVYFFCFVGIKMPHSIATIYQPAVWVTHQMLGLSTEYEAYILWWANIAPDRTPGE